MAYCYILKLDTYYEERTACWKESKLTNGPILGPDQGVPPAPWDLRFSFTPAFEDRRVDDRHSFHASEEAVWELRG